MVVFVIEWVVGVAFLEDYFEGGMGFRVYVIYYCLDIFLVGDIICMFLLLWEVVVVLVRLGVVYF